MSSIHSVNVGGSTYSISDSSNMAPLEATMFASRPYLKGRFMILPDGLMYRAKTDISSSDALVINSNVERANFDDVITDLEKISDTIAPTENEETASTDYVVGDQIIRNGALYDVISAINEDDYLVVGNNIELAPTISKQIQDIKIKAGSPIISIAPSNAPSEVKNKATFVCSGTDDQTIINDAIQLLADGGEIHLLAGLFSITASILVDRDITISGEGAAIGGIPAYTPTNGIVYGSETANQYELKQNLYGETDGRNTCIRVSDDFTALVVNASQKTCINFKDFYINGYGRDRSTKAGIEILCPVDVSSIEHVGVTDAYVGLYAYGDEDAQNGYCDCLWVNKCSFQQCGIGIIARCNSSYFSENCLADNIGVTSYRTVLSVNSGGIYIEGERNSLLNNQIVYADLFCSSPCSAIRLLCKDSRVVDNICCFLNGSGIRVENFSNMIHGNRIESYGWGNVAGYNMGIDIRDNLCDVQNNYLGNTVVNQPYTCNYYGVASSRPLTYHKTNVSNNTFINIITRAVDTTTLLGNDANARLNNVNNVEWSYL